MFNVCNVCCIYDDVVPVYDDDTVHHYVLDDGYGKMIIMIMMLLMMLLISIVVKISVKIVSRLVKLRSLFFVLFKYS